MSEAITSARDLSPDKKRELLEQVLRQRAQREPLYHPLSLIQEPLWFLDKMLQGRPAYHQHGGFRMSGPFNAECFERALNEIVRRHEAMRTVLPAVDGQPLQQIKPYVPFQLPVEDLSRLASEARAEQLKKLCAEEAHSRIDLETGPLWRVRLFRLAAEEHVLYLKIHHITSDGWSVGILFQELMALYRDFAAGRSPSLAPLAVQYRDFTAWQRERLTGARLESLLSYWRRKLAPPLATIDLPFKGTRPVVQTYHGGHRRIQLPIELIDGARAVCRTEQATLFMMLLATFKLLLSRYARQSDIVVGTPVANRSRPEYEPLIGYFASVSVLRTDLGGDITFRELLRRVRDTVIDAFRHQEVPLELLAKELQPERDPSRHPLFQVLFSLQPGRNSAMRDNAGFTFEPLKTGTGSTKFDLQMVVVKQAGHFLLKVGYNTDLFDKEFGERIPDHYRCALEAVVQNPDLPLSQIPLMDNSERRQTLALGEGQALAPPRDIECAHEWFARQAAATPDALAVESGSERLSYAELNARANGLAWHLQELGIGADDRVAVLLPRSAAFVASIIAVLKAGAAYVPLDMQLPPARLREIVMQCGARVLITSAALPGLPATLARILVERIEDLPFDVINPAPLARRHNLAYVIYTSGSTGKPKGVMIEHRALVNYIQAAIHAYQLQASDRVLQFASLSFDAHIEEIFPTLCAGAAIVPRSDAMLDSFPGFLQACAAAGITVLSLPTAYWQELVATMAVQGLRPPASLRLLVIGGERALPERVASWVQQVGHGVRLLNTYGPTETTVIATCYEARDPAHEDRLLPVPIGRPIANSYARILDAQRQPVPVGVVGELYLGGAGLARGYLDDPALTEQRFIADPFSAEPSARLYRSGDLARWRPDGELEFVGRIDAQVKLRGFRVEPEEVEAALNEHPRVMQAAVVVSAGVSGSLRLIACIVARAGAAPPSAVELRDFLSERLPKFMVPSAFLTMTALPTTVTGKIDRRALEQDVGRHALENPTDYEAPATDTERRVAQILAELLRVPRVGRHDNFFDLGGHSLLAVRLMTQLRAVFSVELPLVTVFMRPTTMELARAVDEQPAPTAADTAPARDVARLVEKLFVAEAASPLVALSADDGSRRPIFLAHGLGGHVAIYADLARRLSDHAPVYGLQAVGLDGKSASHGDLTEMAACYIDAMRARQPHGPYRLGGWSMGGMLALEMTQQLLAQGEAIDLLAMFDTHLPRSQERSGEIDDDAAIRWIAARFGVPAPALLALPKQERWRALLERGRQTLILPPQIGEAQLEHLARVCQSHVHALARYQPRPYAGDVLLFRARQPVAKPGRRRNFDTPERWQTLFARLTEHAVPGNHYAIMREPNVATIAEGLIGRLPVALVAH